MVARRNVLIGQDDVARVSDFGMTRIVEDVEAEATTVSKLGPYRYMAPESLEGKKFSPASDVYMVGKDADR